MITSRGVRRLRGRLCRWTAAFAKASACWPDCRFPRASAIHSRMMARRTFGLAIWIPFRGADGNPPDERPNGRELFLDQLQCGAAIAAANGHAPSEGFMRSWEETFSQRDSQYATSMLAHVEARGPTEVEHILGFMLKKASEANIAHRTLLLAYPSI